MLWIGPVGLGAKGNSGKNIMLGTLRPAYHTSPAGVCLRALAIIRNHSEFTTTLTRYATCYPKEAGIIILFAEHNNRKVEDDTYGTGDIAVCVFIRCLIKNHTSAQQKTYCPPLFTLSPLGSFRHNDKATACGCSKILYFPALIKE